MGSPLPNTIWQESGTDLEQLRFVEVAVEHKSASAEVDTKPIGPFDVDLDVRSVWVTPGIKPATNSSNTLDLWLGAPGTTSDVQTITMSGTGGTFRVGFAGVYTAAQANNVSTANLQTALRGLSTIGASNVTVTGTAGSSYVITFAGQLANELMPLMQLDTSLLTGGGATIAHTTPGVGQRIIAQQLDASWTANTPVKYTAGAAPHLPARIPNGTQLTLSVSFNGSDSASPAALNVHVNLEIPLYDQAAKKNNQLAYSRSY